jgi:hypothetical protein
LFNNNETINLLLQQVFGAHCKIVDAHVVKNDPDYTVLIARISRPSLRVVIKLAGSNPPYPCPFDRTATLYRLVADHTDIPMPAVYAADVSLHQFPWRYMIKSHIPGEMWAAIFPTLSQDEQAAAYDELGRAVAQLHNLHFPAFGEIAATGSLIEEQPLLSALGSRARVWITDPVFLDFFLSTLERYSHLFQDVEEASLTHEDLHPYNILFTHQDKHWRLATILDFDKAWAGHCESDLARLHLWRGMSGPAFWQAYQSMRTISPKFTQRRLVYQLLWCLEFAEPSPVHIADTQQVCAALGVRMPKLFDDAR